MTTDLVKSLIETMVKSIVDDTESVSIRQEDTDKGMLYEIAVGKDDVAKLIGKMGRVASAVRTVAKSSGAKLGRQVQVNVLNKPIGE